MTRTPSDETTEKARLLEIAGREYGRHSGPQSDESERVTFARDLHTAALRYARAYYAEARELGLIPEYERVGAATSDIISEGRAHDAAMTPGDWTITTGSRFRGAVSTTVGGVERQVMQADGQAPSFEDVPDPGERAAANAAGVAWMRTNLRALLVLASKAALADSPRPSEADLLHDGIADIIKTFANCEDTGGMRGRLERLLISASVSGAETSVPSDEYCSTTGGGCQLHPRGCPTGEP